VGQLHYGPLEPPLRVSPTALNAFDTCKYRFYLSRKIEPITEEIPDYFRRGLEVHGLMDGSVLPSDAGADSLDMFHRLDQFEQSLGLLPIRRELTQKFIVPGHPNLLFTRRVDMLAYTPAGEAVIVDYKTASRPWKKLKLEGKEVQPSARRWQSAGYLFPPPPEFLEELDLETWPTELWYLVVPATRNARPQRFVVKWTAEMGKDFDNILDEIGAEKYFRQSFGYSCRNCDFVPVCYEAEGWRGLYAEREERE